MGSRGKYISSAGGVSEMKSRSFPGIEFPVEASPMRRFALFFAVFLAAMAAPAQTVPELFQKGKAQVKGEAWKDALATFARWRPRPPSPRTRPTGSSSRGRSRSTAASARPTWTSPTRRRRASRPSWAAAQRHDGSLDVLEEGRRGVRRGAQDRLAPRRTPRATGGPSIFNAYQEFKPPPNISEPPSATWADGPVVLDHDGGREEDLGAAVERRRARRVRREVLGCRATRTATAATTRSRRASSAAWPSRTPSSSRTRRSAAA